MTLLERDVTRIANKLGYMIDRMLEYPHGADMAMVRRPEDEDDERAYSFFEHLKLEGW